MTAVWNNFYDGSKSLEYYSDVMVKLGAATASSTDEISAGVNKFAATAKTVGMSYEYAASALATITARTRESADTVGNALRTLFSRIQGLNLGETLEDGTTLNKYSKALASVGINIKDQYGELKDIDSILDEMGDKWNTLSRDQQTALAQTVGGVRQYAQLMALMNNWDYFKENLQVAYGSEGELEKQAEIYAESWEAAEKRVKASLQGVYQAVLDDKFFISINNGFANILSGLEAFIEGAGGIAPILAGISSIIVSSFAHKIPDALQSAKYNFDVLTKGSEAAYKRIQDQMEKSTEVFFKSKDQGGYGVDKDSAAGQEVINANELLAARNKLALVSDKMTASEKQAANIALDQIQKYQEEVVSLKKKNEEIQKSIDLKVKELEATKKFNSEYTQGLKTADILFEQAQGLWAGDLQATQDARNAIKPSQPKGEDGKWVAGPREFTSEQKAQKTQLDIKGANIEQSQKELEKLKTSFNKIAKDMQSELSSMGKEMLTKWLDPNGAKTQVMSFSKSFKDTLTNLKDQASKLGSGDTWGIEALRKQFTALILTIPEGVREASNFQEAIAKVDAADTVEQLVSAFSEIEVGLQNGTYQVNNLEDALRGLLGNKNVDYLATSMGKMKQNTEEAAKSAQTLKGLIDSFNPTHVVSLSEMITSAAAAAGALYSAFNSIKSIFETINNEDLSFWEKFTAILSSASMLIPTVMSTYENAGNILGFFAQKGASAATTMGAVTTGTTVAGKAAGVAAIGFGKLTLVLAGIGLLVAGVVAVASAIKNAASESEKAYKEFKEANEAYKEATEKLNSLESSLESVRDRIKELNEIENPTLIQQEELDKARESEASLERQVALQRQLAEYEDKRRQNALEQIDVGENISNLKNARNEKTGKQKDNFVATLAEGQQNIQNRQQIVNDEKVSSFIKSYIENEQELLAAKEKGDINRISELQQQLDTIRQDYDVLGASLSFDEAYEAYTSDFNLPELEDFISINLDYLTTPGDYEDVFSIIEDTLSKLKIQYTETANGEVFQTIKKLESIEQELRVSYGEVLQAEEEFINENQQKLLDTLEKLKIEASRAKIGSNALIDIQKKASETQEMLYGDDWKDIVQSSLERELTSSSNIDFGDYLREQYATEKDSGYTDSWDNRISRLQALVSEDFLKSIQAQGMNPFEFFLNYILDVYDEMDEYSKALEGTGISLTDLRKDKRWSDTFLPDLKNISMEGVDSIDDLIDKINELHTETEKLDFLGELTDITKAVSGLSIGDILSEEDYQLLIKYNEALADYFMYTSSGYKYMGGAEGELSQLSLSKQIEGAQKYKDFYNEGSQFQDAINSKYDTVLFTDKGYWTAHKDYQPLEDALLDSSLVDFIKQNTNDEDLKQLDVSQLFGDLTDRDNPEAQQAARNLVVKFFQAFNEAMETGASYTDEKIQSLLFEATVKTWEDLQNFLAENDITDENQISHYQSTLMKSLSEGAGFDYDEIKEYADELEHVSQNEKLTRNGAEQLALANKRLERGIKNVKEHWEDFSSMLEEVDGDFDKLDRQAPNVVSNFQDMKEALADILDWDAKDIDNDLVEMAYSSGQLKGIMEGDADALKDFQKLAANQVVIETNIKDEALKDRFASLTDSLQSAADLDPITLQGYLNDDKFLSACQEMINAAGMTSEQAQSYFDALGYEAEIKKEPVDTSTITSMRVPVFSIDANGDPQVKYSYGTAVSKTTTEILQIKSINKKSPGSGLSANRSSSGGGGGGGGSAPKYAEKKNDSDKERYHTVLNQLEDLKAEYDDISKAKDRAFGKDRLKNFDAEIAKTDELIDKQKEYLDAIEDYLPIDLATMVGYYNDTIGGPEIQFDEKGNISNFDAIQDAMFAKYNQMAETFAEDSTEWEVFEKKYEQLEKYIEQYEETYDLLRDEEQKYQDLINQRLDAQLEKVQYTVEVKLDVSEDQIKLLEYQLGRISDDGFKSLETIGLLTEKANELNKQIETNKQGLNDALNLSLSTAEIAQIMAGNLDALTNKNFTDSQISAIKEYRDNILSLNEELDSLREEVESRLMEAFSAWQEKLEKGIDTIDHYGSVLESYKTIIDIVGTDVLGLNGEFMNNLAQGSVDNAINKLEAVKNEYRSVEDARAEAEQKLKEAQKNGDTKSAEMWENTLADLTEKSQEAQENMLSAWEDALNKLVEQFEQSAERIAESFNKSIYNLGGLEGLGNDFDKAQDRADIMLDDYQKIYELSKLSRDINKSIDDTDLIGGKEKLKKLLKDVNALQEDGVEMSQYDLEYLQKTYDLRLAELELEEAQRAKNTVRLSKDNEGNWSYIYTQNSDAVDQAQQKYEDALYAMQDLSSNYIDEMSKKLIDTSQEMAEALANLRIQDFASIDDYYAEVDRVQKYYQEQLDLQENELNKAILNNKTLYDEDWMAYHNATGYKISDTENFVTSFKDSMLGLLMGSATDESNFTDIIQGSLATMTEQLLAAADTYYRNLEEAMNAADTSVEDFGEDIGASIDEVVAKSEEGATAVEDMADRMNTAVNDLMDTIQSWQESYGLAMEEIINDNLAVIASINELTKKLSLEDYDASVSWNFTKREEPTGMASGGYTGSWGKEGKLGVLHEKELVLNASDTANMLDMLQITRDMINTIDLQAQNARLGFGELVASSIRDPMSEVLEQNVHIVAEFPNVVDHNEIEQALLNLNNTASQYANRK